MREPLCFSSPGKVFLTGEYAALWGGPALVSVAGPCFELRAVAAEGSHILHGFHPQSPAGRLIERAGPLARDGEGWRLDFTDPWNGQGGWGASTAQFLLTRAFLRGESADNKSLTDTLQAWREYRWCTKGGAGPQPSGADLCAQAAGGTVAFRIVDGEARLERTGDHLGAGVEFHLFSASHQAARKLTTHEHLESLRDRLGDASDAASAAARISRAAQTCLESWNSGQALEFGRSAGVFARILDEHGLEHASARRDRLAIEALPGVLGVKGCGAGLADALWVLSEAGAGAEVQSLAVELGLRPVAGFRP